MVRTRISYTTSTCGLPPTNLGGECRSFEPPKRILAKPYKEDPEATEVADTTSKTSNGKEHVVCWFQKKLVNKRFVNQVQPCVEDDSKAAKAEVKENKPKKAKGMAKKIV